MLILTIPPLNGVPDPTFTSGTKLGPRGAWWCAVLHRAPSLLVGHRRLCPGLRPGQSEKATAQFFRISSDIYQRYTTSAKQARVRNKQIIASLHDKNLILLILCRSFTPGNACLRVDIVKPVNKNINIINM